MKALLGIAVIAFGGLNLCAEWPRFAENVAFWISFDDETALADMAAGGHRPIGVSGKLNFVPGVRGKALQCGKDGAKLNFPRSKNLDFDDGGTILFFYRPMDWERNIPGPRLSFFSIESTTGFMDIRLGNDPKNICICQRPFETVFLYSKAFPDKSYQFNTPGKAGCGGTHLLAFSWKSNQLRLNYDNLPGKVYPLGRKISEKAFPSTHFTIGSNADWPYAIDEFIIYDRGLSDEEIAEIYRAVIKNNMQPALFQPLIIVVKS